MPDAALGLDVGACCHEERDLQRLDKLLCSATSRSGINAPDAPVPLQSADKLDVTITSRQHTRCLIPGFDGAIFSTDWKEALWVSFFHGSARTTEAVRRAIQHSEESLRALAGRYGINQKTVAKWKRRTSVADLPTGPQKPRSTVLSGEDEAVIVAFRRHTLLPLDDCLYALQPTIPHLTRSSLHRCLQRHGISRLPDVEGDKPAKKKFRAYPIGYFHIDIAEV